MENLERWDRIWKKKVETQTIVLIFSILFLVLSIYMIKTDIKPGFIFLPLSLFGLFVTMNFLTQARKQKKEYLERINAISERYQKQDAPIVWNFEDEHIGYKDYQSEIKYAWSAFSHYYVKDKSVFFVMRDNSDAVFSINESEVGATPFNDIIEFAGRKINK